MIGSAAVRIRWRLASAALLAVGLGALGLGLWSTTGGRDTAPRPIPAQQWTALPSAGIFGGRVAVYGHPDTELAPTPAQLGCRLSYAGRLVQGGLSPDGTADLDRLVSDGWALVPLLVVTVDADHVRCSGPALATSAPVYAVVQRGVDDMVPMAAFSLTSLAVVLGLAGLVLLRPTER
jgi:hypothetical protein